MDRKEKWLKVLEALKEIGEDLNTVGNDDWNEMDYYFEDKIKQVIEGYKNTY